VPRYFFDLHNDIEALDPEGREFPDAESACANAVVEAREMMVESLRMGHINLNHRIEVRDEAGEVIYNLHFGEVVQVIPKHKVA